MLKERNICILIFFLICAYACREDKIEVTEPVLNSGSIMISSVPEGARIYLNGFYKHKITPDSLVGLNPGIYSIELEGSLEFSDTTFIAYLQQGEKLNYNIILRSVDHRINSNFGNFPK